MLKFGLSTLSQRAFTSPDAYLSVMAAAEAAGFDFVSVSDHVVIPGKRETHYPYATGGAFGGADQGHCFDQLSTIAFLAGVTSRIRLLASVMVVPHRPAVLSAKMLATIDVLSQGRLIIGAGAGWMKEEFAILGANFPDRGKITDEYLAAFVELWTSERPAFHGEHVSFTDVVFEPKPLQKPHPPLWIGGESPPAIRRAIARGDTWYPGNNSQTLSLDTPPRLAKGITAVYEQCEAQGRDPATLGIALLVQDVFEWEACLVADGTARRMFTGTSSDMIGDAQALSGAGVGHVALRLRSDTVDDAVERVQRFGAEVIDKL